jgi:hypothetical protein
MAATPESEPPRFRAALDEATAFVSDVSRLQIVIDVKSATAAMPDEEGAFRRSCLCDENRLCRAF